MLLIIWESMFPDFPQNYIFIIHEHTSHSHTCRRSSGSLPTPLGFTLRYAIYILPPKYPAPAGLGIVVVVNNVRIRKFEMTRQLELQAYVKKYKMFNTKFSKSRIQIQGK